VHVVVVHLGLVPASRLRQVEQLGRYIEREVDPRAPLLVAGDFNDWGQRLCRMMAELGRHLAQQGTHWVISTVTRELRHLFLRMGIAPLALGVADPERLGERALDWGTYYHHEPVVLAVVLAQTQRLRPRLVAGA
jgi:hypothetical protein